MCGRCVAAKHREGAGKAILGCIVKKGLFAKKGCLVKTLLGSGVAPGSACRAGIACQAALVPAGKPRRRTGMGLAGRRIEAGRIIGLNRTGRQAGLRIAGIAGMPRGLGRKHVQRLAKQERAAIGMPQAEHGMHQKAER